MERWLEEIAGASRALGVFPFSARHMVFPFFFVPETTEHVPSLWSIKNQISLFLFFPLSSFIFLPPPSLPYSFPSGRRVMTAALVILFFFTELHVSLSLSLSACSGFLYTGWI
jgi:hypothetical protein